VPPDQLLSWMNEVRLQSGALPSELKPLWCLIGLIDGIALFGHIIDKFSGELVVGIVFLIFKVFDLCNLTLLMFFFSKINT
jgi:hypothetical protein